MRCVHSLFSSSLQSLAFISFGNFGFLFLCFFYMLIFYYFVHLHPYPIHHTDFLLAVQVGLTVILDPLGIANRPIPNSYLIANENNILVIDSLLNFVLSINLGWVDSDSENDLLFLNLESIQHILVDTNKFLERTANKLIKVVANTIDIYKSHYQIV